MPTSICAYMSLEASQSSSHPAPFARSVFLVTSILILIGGQGPGFQANALYRVSATAIGVLLASGVALLWPQRARTLLRYRIAKNLDSHIAPLLAQSLQISASLRFPSRYASTFLESMKQDDIISPTEDDDDGLERGISSEGGIGVARESSGVMKPVVRMREHYSMQLKVLEEARFEPSFMGRPFEEAEVQRIMRVQRAIMDRVADLHFVSHTLRSQLRKSSGGLETTTSPFFCEEWDEMSRDAGQDLCEIATAIQQKHVIHRTIEHPLRTTFARLKSRVYELARESTMSTMELVELYTLLWTLQDIVAEIAHLENAYTHFVISNQCALPPGVFIGRQWS